MSEAIKPLTAPRELFGPPGDVNPTLLVFVAAVIIVVLSTLGYFCWGWLHWCCFCLNLLAFHMVGTVIHDACHGVAHRNRIVNALLGHGSAFLLCFSFPVFTRVHMQHHANVNDPDNDPDHFVSTMGPLWLINARFFYHEVFFFRRKLWRKYELFEWILARLSLVAMIAASFHFGVNDYVFNYWFPPLAIVGLLLGLFFDYLPHRPFKERDRWHNARVYPSFMLNWLIMGQNYHLVHHLWPSIPWYYYEKAYFQMQPLLDAKGSKQSIGLLKEDFLGFVYDIFLGIRFHPKSSHSESPLPLPEPVAISSVMAEHATPPVELSSRARHDQDLVA
jgi:beta-carotene hydroxylase